MPVEDLKRKEGLSNEDVENSGLRSHKREGNIKIEDKKSVV